MEELLDGLEADGRKNQEAKLQRGLALLKVLCPSLSERLELVTLDRLKLLCQYVWQMVIPFYPAAKEIIKKKTEDLEKKLDDSYKLCKDFLVADREKENIIRMIAYFCYFVEQLIFLPNEQLIRQVAAQQACQASTPSSRLSAEEEQQHQQAALKLLHLLHQQHQQSSLLNQSASQAAQVSPPPQSSPLIVLPTSSEPSSLPL